MLPFLIFSISASCKRFAFARRFWNQILTCVSVKRSDDENSARSAMLKYCFSRNFFSSDSSWAWMKNDRGEKRENCSLISIASNDVSQGLFRCAKHWQWWTYRCEWCPWLSVGLVLSQIAFDSRYLIVIWNEKERGRGLELLSICGNKTSGSGWTVIRVEINFRHLNNVSHSARQRRSENEIETKQMEFHIGMNGFHSTQPEPPHRHTATQMETSFVAFDLSSKIN